MILFEQSVCRDGYEIIDGQVVARSEVDDQLIENDVTDLGTGPIGNLFQEFANLEETEKSVIDFANKFGLMHTKLTSIDEWFIQIRRVRQVLEFAQREQWSQAEELIEMSWLHRSVLPHFRTTALEGGLELFLKPPTLLSFLWLQLGMALSGKMKIDNCAHCGRIFTAGGGPTRKLRKYCSPKCQKAFNNRELSKQRKMERAKKSKVKKDVSPKKRVDKPVR